MKKLAILGLIVSATALAACLRWPDQAGVRFFYSEPVEEQGRSGARVGVSPEFVWDTGERRQRDLTTLDILKRQEAVQLATAADRGIEVNLRGDGEGDSPESGSLPEAVLKGEVDDSTLVRLGYWIIGAVGLVVLATVLAWARRSWTDAHRDDPGSPPS